MPRRREVPKRDILPDPVYHSELASKVINQMMYKGKKSVAESIFYDAMELIEKQVGEDPMKILKKALDNVKPVLETKSRRVGGSTYQVPIEVSIRRRTSLGIRWIINYSQGRGEKLMAERLSNELLDAANNRGNAVRKKEDIRRMARLFWFTIEFGLVREDGKIKVYGSGLISSVADGANALGPKCDRRPFDLDAVVNQPFEIDHLQDVLFVIDSFDELFEAVAELAARS